MKTSSPHMRLFLALLLPPALFADPITITVLDLSTQTSVFAAAGPNICRQMDPVSSSCSVTGPLLGEAAIAMASVNGLNLTALATTGDFNSGAFGSATFAETIQINGGTGTGYLNIGTQISLDNPFDASFRMSINGVPLYFNPAFVGPFYFVAPFEFGQPFSINISADAGAASTDQFSYGRVQASIINQRLYSHMPTGCDFFFQPCSDPTFTPVDVLTGVAIPEPSTLPPAGLGLFALALVHRVRRIKTHLSARR